jgi:hypothetical protein
MGKQHIHLAKKFLESVYIFRTLCSLVLSLKCAIIKGRERLSMAKAKEPKVIEAQDEDHFLALVGKQNGSMPIQVVTKSVGDRRETLLHRVYDGVEDIPVEEEISNMGIKEASKVIARLDTSRDVKIDHSITAMALIGMFPGAREVEER